MSLSENYHTFEPSAPLTLQTDMGVILRGVTLANKTMDELHEQRTRTIAANMQEWRESTVITNMLGMHELHFTTQPDADGRQERLHTPYRFTHHRRPAIAYGLERLSDIAELGSGSHDMHAIARVLDITDRGALYACQDLAKILPPELFRVNEEAMTLHIGNIALATRNVGPEEKEALRRQDIQEKDRHKTSFIEFDHVRACTENFTFYLELDAPDTFVAARTMQAISRMSQDDNQLGKPSNAAELISQVWDEMPIAERQFFVKNDKDMYNTTGNPIKPSVLAFLRYASSPMGLTRETSHEKFKIEQRSSVTIHAEPLAEDDDRKNYVPIFPPGTLRERRDTYYGNAIPTKSLAEADDIITTYLKIDAVPSQEQALTILSFIMDRDGKRALRAVLEADDSPISLDACVKRLKNKLASTLGEGYDSAHSYRTIAGNIFTGTGRARQTSAGVSPQTTKWHIGTKFGPRR